MTRPSASDYVAHPHADAATWFVAIRLGGVLARREAVLATLGSNLDDALVAQRASAKSGARLYPDTVPPFEGEPFREDFEVRDLGDPVGRAVVSHRNFHVGDVLASFAGEWISEITQFSLQRTPNSHIEDLHFAGMMTHSCSPSCKVIFDPPRIVALKPVSAGEILTIDYDDTEDVLARGFQCRCGSATCRGWVSGRSGLTK